MAGQCAAIVFTVPHDLPIYGHVSGKGKRRYREFVRASGELTNARYVVFLTKALKNLAANSVQLRSGKSSPGTRVACMARSEASTRKGIAAGFGHSFDKCGRTSRTCGGTASSVR
jgi:hypothetical protein